MEEVQSRNGAATGAIAIAVVAILLGIYALGVALSARNGSGASIGTSAPAASQESPAGATSVAASLTEFAIAPAELVVAEGGTIEVTNDGAVPHNLAVRGSDLTTADLDGGQSESLALGDLPAGTYEVFCSIPGHETAGMVASLTVGGSGPAPAATEGEADGHSGMDHEGGDWQAMWDTMEASIKAFPAETEGTGLEIMEPTVLDDGTKEFVLVADEMEWEVEPGKVVEGIAYNGQIPGPTIKVDVGDRVRIVIDNQLDEITSWHPHGVRNHPIEADGVGFVTQDPIKPGETWSAEFVVDELSVGMYHGHDMGVHQVPNGLVGAFLVGQVPVPEGLEVVDEVSMVLNDAGNIGYSLNGKSFPATSPYVLEQGQAMLVHYMHEGQMNHPMHLHGNRQLVLAKDGFPLESPYYVDTLDIAPGERYTVLVEAENVGTWVWHCHILNHVEKSDGSMFGMLTALVVTEPGA